MSVAPQVAAWGRRPGRFGYGLPFPSAAGAALPDGGTGGAIGLMVELYLNNAWTDISPYVYYGDKITITRGRPDETSQPQPQTATLTINNRDGRFSPRNPLGPWYGQIGRNTPIRISRLNNGIRRYRFHGEVPSWPTTWDISGKDVRVGITAAGMLRRLSQGSAVLGSALYRLYTTPNVQPQFFSSPPLPLAAYWPCQDGKNSTSIVSAVPGGAPMVLSGQASPSFTQNTDFVCSDPLPLLSGSIWTGSVGTYVGGVDNVVNLLLSVPSGGAFDTAVVCRVLTQGTVARLDMQYLVAGNGSLRIVGYGTTGATLFTSATVTNVNANPMRVQLVLQQTGSSIIWALDPLPVLANAPFPGAASGTLATASVGNVTTVIVNPDGHVNDTAVGHLVVQYNYNALVDDAFATIAWELDTPDVSDPPGTGGIVSRFSRLCGEQQVPAVVIQGPAGYDLFVGSTVYMGDQLSDTFLNLIQQPVDQTLGLLFEARDQNSLVLRTRGSLYNQAAKLTLNYSAHQLSGPLNPVDDDALTRNDVTASRIGGSSATAKLTSGALSVLPFPNGVGDYQTSYSISLFDDSGLADHAGWRLHMGTVDEPRYPQISVNLRHGTFTSSVDMMNAALTIDIGDRLVVTNPPAWMPSDAISQILQGYSETLGTWEHDMTLNCSPESPYRIAILEDTVLGHADTDGSTLAFPAGSADTSIQVTTTGFTTGSPLWTTSAGDFPFDINVGGERITVQNITGAGATQTFNPVVRSVNGVVKSQTAGTDVRLWQPMILSL
jgi:hypothetical protein